MKDKNGNESRGELVLRTLAMPADANPSGDIFGGWLISQMDLGAGMKAGQRAFGGRVTTVAIDAMTFHLPVFVGDVICVYADVEQVGRTSMRIHVEAWSIRHQGGESLRVTEGKFTFVALDGEGKPRPVDL